MAKPQRSKRRKALGKLTEPDPVSEEERLETEKKMCAEKKRFAFRCDAERLGKEYGLGIYQCPFCGGWHFTGKKTPPI